MFLENSRLTSMCLGLGSSFISYVLGGGFFLLFAFGVQCLLLLTANTILVWEKDHHEMSEGL